MSNSLISVIVPCYNQAQYLGEALQSVLDQTYTNWECIIVNDGSPDDTHDVAQEWLAKDARFKYIQKENGGLSSARNAGIEIAVGDWIQFLDCDDLLNKDKFQNCFYAFNQSDTTILISNYNIFESRNGINKYFPPNRILNQDLLTFESILQNWDISFTIPIHCGLFPKNIFKSIRFNEILKAKEDCLFWIQVAQNGNSFVFINEILAYYRMHEFSMTKDNNNMIMNNILLFKEIEKIIQPADYRLFIFSKLEYYFTNNLMLKHKLRETRKSNSFKLGLLLKKIVVKLGSLSLAKLMFSYILKFLKF